MAKSSRETNGIDKDLASQFYGDIQRQYEELATLKGEYMKKCRDRRDIISDLLDRAKDAGIPKKEFRAFIKHQELLARANGVVDQLESDEQEIFEMLRSALGGLADTPLGGAALKAAEEKASKKAKDKENVSSLVN